MTIEEIFKEKNLEKRLRLIQKALFKQSSLENKCGNRDTANELAIAAHSLATTIRHIKLAEKENKKYVNT